MMGWEKATKVGKGLEFIFDFKGKNTLQSNEAGYALRTFFKDRVSFFSSSGFLKEFSLKENINDFYLPKTIGHFEPEITRKDTSVYLEEIYENIKKEISCYRKFEILKAVLSYSEFYLEIVNFSGGKVSLKNYSINGTVILGRDNLIWNLPFLSNLDLTISFSDYFSILKPYLQLPLPQMDLKPSRYPLLLHPLALSLIFEGFLKYFLSGEIEEIPSGFKIKDLPFHPKSPNYFPVDGEGALKKEFLIKKGNIPLDYYNALKQGKISTGNSFRNSIYLPPEIGFHNIVLEGPEGNIENMDKYLYFTFPKKMEEDLPFFLLEGEAFLYKGGKPLYFFPSIFLKFTLKDFFSSFYFIKKPLIFYCFSTPFGLPFLFLKGLSVYPFL
ncbi:MAG: metallopeptidase TldD-related protein [Thermoanaerobaculia bacterium]